MELDAWYPQRRGTSLRDAAARIQARTHEQIHISSVTESPRRWEPRTRPTIIPVPPDMIDLTGLRIGQLTVIGLHRREVPQRMSWWAVLCACGLYDMRLQRWVKNPRMNKTIDAACCRSCQQK